MATIRTAGNSRVATVRAPSGGLVEGQPIQMGHMFGVAIEDANEGAITGIVIEGIVEFPKDPVVETSAGDVMYWNQSTGYVDKTRDKPDKVPIGWAMADTDLTDMLLDVMLCPSVQVLPVVGSFVVQRGIDPNPKQIIDPLCQADGQVVLTPTNGAAASVPFWAIADDGFFDVWYEEALQAYAAVNSDGASVSATTTPAVIDLLVDEGSLNFDIDLSADTVTVQVAGLYDFRLNMNGTASRNRTYIFRARVNGIPVGQPVTFVMSGNIDDFSFGDSGFFPFDVGDVVDFTVETSSSSGTLNFEQFSLSMLRAGYTTPEWISAGFKYLVVQ